MRSIIKKLKKYTYLTRRSAKNLALFTVLVYRKAFLKQYPKHLLKASEEKIITISDMFYPISPKDFGKEELVLEIGSGHGEFARNFCLQASKDGHLFKKFDISRNSLLITTEYTKRFYKLTCNRVKSCDNVLPVYADGYKVMHLFAKESLKAIFILFPDPWHKKKHHKRRPLHHKTLKTMIKRLAPGGTIFIATDHAEYFEFIKQNALQIENASSAKLTIKTGSFNPSEWGIPQTHYYKKWLRWGKEFKFLLIRKGGSTFGDGIKMQTVDRSRAQSHPG